MWLPTKLQVDSASRHAISIAGTAITIFGLQAKGITIEQVTAVIQSLGSVVNDLLVLVGAIAPLYALLKAAHSASPTSQVAAVQDIATGTAGPVAVSAQKALINATSAVAQDASIPVSEDAKNTLIAATIALPSVQTIITDQATATTIALPSVVASSEPVTRVN